MILSIDWISNAGILISGTNGTTIISVQILTTQIRLLKKNKIIQNDWSIEHDQAIEEIKNKLCNPPVLVHDDGVSPI